MEYKKHKRRLRHWLSSPFIYLMVFPLVLIDICTEVYHQICFRLYEIELVSRSSYIKIDRHKLQYLSLFDKLNCTYCGYANGLLRYNCEIAARTEKYWCGIKHKPDQNFIEPEHHKEFIDYNNEKKYKDN